MVKKSTDIFKDVELQNLFDKQGFVVVRLLDDIAINEIRKLFNTMHPKISERGFISGGYSTDFHYKEKINKELSAIHAPYCETMFENHTIYGATFVYKTPTLNSELDSHQDWSIVDENKFVSLNCWTPTDKINQYNGPLYLLPGSNFANNTSYRAPTIIPAYKNKGYILRKYMQPIIPRLGESIILNHSTIHFSPPNFSRKTRVASIAAIKSKEAKTIFYYKDKATPNDLEIFEIADDFHLRFDDFFKNIWERPLNASLINKIKIPFQETTDEKLNQKLNALFKKAQFIPAQLSFQEKLQYFFCRLTLK